MPEIEKPLFSIEEFVPSLREAVKEPPYEEGRQMRAAIPVKDPNTRPLVPASWDRNEMAVTDGKGFWRWRIDSVRDLFRGEAEPPVLGDTPEAYTREFFLLESHALELSRFFGARRDQEMLEIYTALRKRPDGRSTGFFHDYMRQGAALMLGMCPLSEKEFEAILGRLERSCRTFRMGSTSRNYIETLRQFQPRVEDH